MKYKLLIPLVICGIIVICVLLGYPPFYAVCGIAVILIVGIAWYVIETLSAMRQSLEKIEQQLEEMKKTGP